METAAQSTAALEAQITELAGHLNSANHSLLVLIAEFDRRNGWADSATQSCAHWLNWKCGIDLGAAREKVRVARALECLPRISSAMARGELSYSKVRALTRVASPETEELLLSIALHGTAHHVETTVRCCRRAQQAEELSREARQQAARRVSYSYNEDGSLVVKASLPAETGALFVKALEAAVEAMDEHERVSAETSAAGENPTPGEQPTRSVRRADALARIAESFLARYGGALGRRSASACGACRCADAPPALRRALRACGRPSAACGNRTAPGLRCQRDRYPGRRGRRTAQRRPQDAHDSPSHSPRPPLPRPGLLPLPGLLQQTLRGRPSHPALGRGRRDAPVEPCAPGPIPPSTGP
jgi:hypothetical protein